MSSYYQLEIQKKDFNAEVSLPISKSIANRQLILSAFQNKLPLLKGDFPDDVILLNHLLRLIKKNSDRNLKTQEITVLDCKNAGTVLRFLTSYLAIKPGKWLLTGSSRMKERPIGQLVESLLKLDAKITYAEKIGFPPILIEGKKLTGRKLVLDTRISSQFVSSLLMISPLIQGGLTVYLKNELYSQPYIEMTIDLLKQCGIIVNQNKDFISVDQQSFKYIPDSIEPDWSAASYWYQIVAQSEKSEILLLGLKKDSLQGDSILPEIFLKLGVSSTFKPEGILLKKVSKHNSEFTQDFRNYPDLAPAIICCCAALEIPAVFIGLESLKIKESDRLSALSIELKKINVNFFEAEKGIWELKFFKTKSIDFPIRINTYGDHRIAMAFAPLVIKFNKIQIENPNVVSKSYPAFWEELKKTGIRIIQEEIQ